jgi:hypothetical protein
VQLSVSVQWVVYHVSNKQSLLFRKNVSVCGRYLDYSGYQREVDLCLDTEQELAISVVYHTGYLNK